MSINIDNSDIDAQARAIFSTENVQIQDQATDSQNQATDFDDRDFDDLFGELPAISSVRPSYTLFDYLSVNNYFPVRQEPILEEGPIVFPYDLFPTDPEATEIFLSGLISNRPHIRPPDVVSIVAANDEIVKEFEGLTAGERANLIECLIEKRDDAPVTGVMDLTEGGCDGDPETMPGTEAVYAVSREQRWGENKKFIQLKISQLEIVKSVGYGFIYIPLYHEEGNLDGSF